MCGIVGYIGPHRAGSILVEGLKRLEYRGYDSAGLATIESNELRVIKRVGRVAELAKATALLKPQGNIGISHTRWATHGGVTEPNTHPHVSNDGRLALVHNGVIENYDAIKRFLLSRDYTFRSETDTEVLTNLLEYHYAKEDQAQGWLGLVNALRKTLLHVEGTYGLVILCQDFPDRLLATRKGSPLLIGVGDNEHVVASDVSAFIGRTRNVVYLQDGEVADVRANELNLTSAEAAVIAPIVNEVTWNAEDAEMGDYDHFMLKEIFEQPEALKNAMRGRFSTDESTTVFGGLNLSPADLRGIKRIHLLSCGTGWHACLVAEHLIERYARIPVEVDYASEFRYRNVPLDPATLFIVISQSGETIDTLSAMREAKRKGFNVLAICNTVGSSIAREADGGIYQHAGPEIGVASTKAFTSQVLIAAMLAIHLGRLRDLSYAEGAALVKALKRVPELVEQTLKQAEKIKVVAEAFAHHPDFLFLGRMDLFPIALEGALKLKEISYIHAEGYPAAEMKHGPIALISKDCPSLVIAPRGELLNKVISSMQEVKARGGPIIALTNEGTELPAGLADATLIIPECDDIVLPLLATIPLQLFSYYVACARGCDVDKPRNLAKAVTVE